jgi:hypothetical protein
MPNTFAAMEYLDETTGTELDGDSRGKFQPRTDHEGPEGEYIYNSTLSLTSVLHEVGGQGHASAALPRERSCIHYIWGWVGPMPGLDGCGKLASTGIRSPNRPARSESLYRLSCPGDSIGENSGVLEKRLQAVMTWRRKNRGLASCAQTLGI